MIVASTQFNLQAIKSESDYWKRVTQLCDKAKKSDSQAILFPENFPLPLLMAENEGTFLERFHTSTKIETFFLSKMQELASQFDMAIIAGSFPHSIAEKRYSRCWIFRPDTAPLYQDKVHLTKMEKEEWGIEPGAPTMQVFRHAGALCAVAICYDVEFPQYCAAAAASGVEVLFVPSCNEDIFGYWRVRHCSAARAIENQCFVVISSAIKGDPAFRELATHSGRAAILSPCDGGFPEDGILAEGKGTQEGTIISNLDFAALLRVRKSGTVMNLQDCKDIPAVQVQNES